ncbi:hypothetical protein C2G38_2188615 [Gigaspora rosea]|uniref:Uncharacterized protein n=1 Tax=Gigaspora rosea TaxID=44941 RepID=A0A397V7Q7_9GLOM|nr:hypothetical protein C2G38_2188615 [Gigaspora rosea]
MPAKLSTICYIHSCTECIVREFIIKEATGIVRLQDDDPTKIIYLNVKAFLSVNEPTNNLIEPFETGDVEYLKGKFIRNNNYYSTVKEIEGNLILEFHVDERIGNKEASNFTVEAKHSSNNKYLSNKTTSINQNARVTTVVLVGTIYYQFENNVFSGKHIVILEDLSIIISNHEFLNTQPRLFLASLSNMNATSTQQNLSAALGKNPIPNMTNEQPAQDQNNQDNTENTK